MIKIKLSYSKEGVCRGNWLILSNWAMNFHTVVVFLDGKQQLHNNLLPK